MEISRLYKKDIEECIDLFMDVFSKTPWFEVYESKAQVRKFFENHLENNYFIGYVLRKSEKIIAVSIGMKKPWLEGMEYYIDQFWVTFEFQGQGIGSKFLKMIEERIKAEGMNGIMLNTERSFPSKSFYAKNGFESQEELVILTKIL